MKLIDKLPWGKLIGRAPKKPLTREEVEEMITAHNDTATDKTKLLIHEHANCCATKIDQRFKEHALSDEAWRRQETEERREFRREMLDSTKRIHERLDKIADK